MGDNVYEKIMDFLVGQDVLDGYEGYVAYDSDDQAILRKIAANFLRQQNYDLMDEEDYEDPNELYKALTEWEADFGMEDYDEADND